MKKGRIERKVKKKVRREGGGRGGRGRRRGGREEAKRLVKGFINPKTSRLRFTEPQNALDSSLAIYRSTRDCGDEYLTVVTGMTTIDPHCSFTGFAPVTA